MRYLREGTWRAPAALVLAGVVGWQAGCGTKGGGGSRADDAERASGIASFRLADADVVVRVAPSKIVGSRAFRGFTDEIAKDALLGSSMPSSPGQMLKQGLGIDPAKVERALVCRNTRSGVSFVAARSRKALDPAAVLADISKTSGRQLKESGRHRGVALYVPEGDAEGDTEGAFAFPGGTPSAEGKLLVWGPSADVRRGIDNLEAGRYAGFHAAVAELLGSAPPAADLVVAAVPSPDLLDRIRRVVPAAAAAIPYLERVEGVLVAARAGKAFDVTLRFTMKKAEDAADARKGAAEGLAGAGQNAAFAKPALKPLGDLLASAKVGGAGRTVEVTASLKPEIVRAFAPLMGLVMAGGFGGGTAPPSGP